MASHREVSTYSERTTLSKYPAIYLFCRDFVSCRIKNTAVFSYLSSSSSFLLLLCVLCPWSGLYFFRISTVDGPIRELPVTDHSGWGPGMRDQGIAPHRPFWVGTWNARSQTGSGAARLLTWELADAGTCLISWSMPTVFGLHMGHRSAQNLCVVETAMLQKRACHRWRWST